MKFFSCLYPQKTGVSKNVQNYKKSAVCPKPKSLKNTKFDVVHYPRKPMISIPFSPFQIIPFFVQMWGKNHRFGQKPNDFRPNVDQNTHFWTKTQILLGNHNSANKSRVVS